MLQVISAKSDSKSGMVASRKKKLARVGAEKNAHGHRFRAQQDSWKGISSGIREGSVHGKTLLWGDFSATVLLCFKFRLL